MKTAVLTVKIDPDLKTKAQKLAAELGMPLGTLIGVLLKDVVRQGRLAVGGSKEYPPEKMAPKLEKLIGEIEEERKNGTLELSPEFDNAKDLMRYLRSHDNQDDKKV